MFVTLLRQNDDIRIVVRETRCSESNRAGRNMDLVRAHGKHFFEGSNAAAGKIEGVIHESHHALGD